jgi:hypothetical protein
MIDFKIESKAIHGVVSITKAIGPLRSRGRWYGLFVRDGREAAIRITEGRSAS